MVVMRQCSKTGCRRAAVATLTYGYADQTVVLGPLATYAEPHTYDLCDQHAERLTAPRGWEIVRLAVDLTPAPPPPIDDLLAVADAVRESSRGSARPAASAAPAPVPGPPAYPPGEGTRRGHLRVVRSP